MITNLPTLKYGKYVKAQRHTISRGDFVYATLLQFLAGQIRIIVLQNKPKENQKKLDPLRQSYMDMYDTSLLGSKFLNP